MYKLTAVMKLQNFSGDATGTLWGNYALFASAEDAAAGKPAFASIGVQAKLAAGEDPLATIDKALRARTDLPTLTEI